jgi:hypothetical protein
MYDVRCRLRQTTKGKEKEKSHRGMKKNHLIDWLKEKRKQ